MRAKSDSTRVETCIGPIWIVPTQANHIHASNGSNALNGDRSLPHVHAPFVIRGVEIAVSAHFHKWADGKWHIGREESTEYDRRHSLYASRLISTGDVSESARKKIADVLTPVVNAWASANVKAIQQAEVEHAEMVLESAQGDYDKAKAAEHAAELALVAAKIALSNAKKALEAA